MVISVLILNTLATNWNWFLGKKNTISKEGETLRVSLRRSIAFAKQFKLNGLLKFIVRSNLDYEKERRFKYKSVAVNLQVASQ